MKTNGVEEEPGGVVQDRAMGRVTMAAALVGSREASTSHTGNGCLK